MILSVTIFTTGCSMHVYKRSDSPYTQYTQYTPTPYPYYIPQEKPQQYSLPVQEQSRTAALPAPTPQYTSKQVAAPQVIHVESEPEPIVQVVEEVVVTTAAPDHIWVSAQVIADDIIIPGFYRPQVRVGFTWTNGYWQGGIYIPGFWRPVKKHARGYMWVPGHWYGGRWVKGLWRYTRRSGYVWIPGHWNNEGVWAHGHWRPKNHRRGYVWIPGHWDQHEHWKFGQWRLKHRQGYVWVKGRYNRHGIWTAGSWKNVPKGKVWVRGYWNQQGGWVKGLWREQSRQGYNYRKGHYDRKGHWQPGRWKPKQRQPKYGTGTYGRSKTKVIVNESASKRSKIKDTVEKQEALKQYEDAEDEFEYQQHPRGEHRKSKVKKVVITTEKRKPKVIIKKDRRNKKVVITKKEKQNKHKHKDKYGQENRKQKKKTEVIVEEKKPGKSGKSKIKKIVVTK